MVYPVRTPWILKKLYPLATWELPGDGNKVYLSFDDGPTPGVTNFVLDQLQQYQQRATFFCIGSNVVDHPQIYQRIISEGHGVGNHTQHHCNGWKTTDALYLQDVRDAAAVIQSKLFRPPYGRATRRQMKTLTQTGFEMKIVMWTLLSGDFDTGISKEKCLDNVLRKIRPGDIITFHDSRKAEEKLRYVLPLVLKNLAARGWQSEVIH